MTIQKIIFIHIQKIIIQFFHCSKAKAQIIVSNITVQVRGGNKLTIGWEATNFNSSYWNSNFYMYFYTSTGQYYGNYYMYPSYNPGSQGPLNTTFTAYSESFTGTLPGCVTITSIYIQAYENWPPYSYSTVVGISTSLQICTYFNFFNPLS